MITISLFSCAATPLRPTVRLETLQFPGQRQQQYSELKLWKRDAPATGEARCGAHVFEGVFGLEHEPVKSVKMKVETRSGLPHPHKTAKPRSWSTPTGAPKHHRKTLYQDRNWWIPKRTPHRKTRLSGPTLVGCGAHPTPLNHRKTPWSGIGKWRLGAGRGLKFCRLHRVASGWPSTTSHGYSSI